MAGTLYVVATPIGNLEDFTAGVPDSQGGRADPRRGHACHAQALHPLRHRDTALSFDAHREHAAVDTIVERSLAGDDVALCSDAGTPLVADPGFPLVRDALDRGIAVRTIPGPSALIAALSVSGLPVDRFTFLGYFPRKAAAAEALLAEPLAGTLVFLEAPHRIAATLDLLARVDPSRPVAVARELTKIHEEVLRGQAEELRDRTRSRTWKGEIVLLLGPRGSAPPRPAMSLRDEYDAAIARGSSRAEALRAVSRRSGLPRREVYARIAATREGE
ncbi:MAG: ribosomal RNA small subunit methyltransferase I [Acidobacteriota bacterium]